MSSESLRGSADAKTDLPDPVWEREIYAQGKQLNRYPFDAVVSFVFANAPKKPRSETHILELGCGAGNNLWFAAREGFAVTGVDASPTAITYARERFRREGLDGEFHVLPFSPLAFPDDRFDLVIDRVALTCVGRSAARRALQEISRVTMPRGRLFFNPYSSRHTSALSGVVGSDDVVSDMAGGDLAHHGGICFYDRAQIAAVLPDEAWTVRGCHHVETADIQNGHIHAEWHVVAERR